ncbi:MAG: hypothetical protein ACI9KE_000651 [Polyangiales bacterium]|jgi:hypothetical protein
MARCLLTARPNRSATRAFPPSGDAVLGRPVWRATAPVQRTPIVRMGWRVRMASVHPARRTANANATNTAAPVHVGQLARVTRVAPKRSFARRDAARAARVTPTVPELSAATKTAVCSHAPSGPPAAEKAGGARPANCTSPSASSRYARVSSAPPLRQMAASSFAGCEGTVRTGRFEVRTTRSATLPMTRRASPVRPWVPITMRSTSRVSASALIIP